MASRTVELVFKVVVQGEEKLKGLGDQTTKGAEKKLSGFSKLVDGIKSNYLNVRTAIQDAIAAGKKFYDVLIASNERLNQELLKSQANLAATSRIFRDGQEITDPREAVEATRPLLDSAIRELEVATDALVGVTSREVNSVFQTVLQNASKLNNQSKEFTSSIEAAVPLSTGLVAALGTIGVPLEQASQEIRSIVQGQVTSDSILAKSLGITNQIVAEWRSQGVLVDKLNEKLDVYVEANALAARSVSGLSSNIQDVFERITRAAGEPFLEPIIDGLAFIEKFLQDNKEAITEFLVSFSTNAAQFGRELVTALEPLGDDVLALVLELGESAKLLFDGAIRGILVVVDVLKKSGIEKKIQAITFVLNGLNEATKLLQLRAFADSEEAVEAYRGSIEQLSFEINRARLRLEKYQEIQKNGGELTAEQQADLERQSDLLNNQLLPALQAETEGLEDLAVQGEVAEASKQALIDVSEGVVASAADVTAAIETESIELENLGTAYDQVIDRILNLQTAIDTATTSDEANKSAGDLIKTLQTGFEQGFIGVAEYRNQLQGIASDGRLSFEVLLQAEQALTQITEQESARRVKAIETEINTVETEVLQGTKTRIEAEEEITRLQGNRINEQISNIEKLIEAEQLRVQQANESLQAEIALQEKEIADTSKENERFKAELEERYAAVEDLQRQWTEAERIGTETRRNTRNEEIRAKIAEKQQLIA